MDYKGNLYNWNVTDHYGWANEKSDVDDRFLFSINLHDKNNSMEMVMATFYPKDKIFKINAFDSKGVFVRFKAENIQQCENILQFILEPNNLEVFNKYKIK